MKTQTQAHIFDGCYTVEAIKALYRTLARQHHPDLGGSTATMQEINAAYHDALAAVDGQESHDENGKAHHYAYNRERESAIMDKLAELLRILPAGCEVYLIGYWLWINGTTREDVETRAGLKSAHCQWHTKRKCWYWRPQELRHFGKQSRHGLAGLAAKYGCREFAARCETELATA
jgi:curved DNA-binding protein CbpA